MLNVKLLSTTEMYEQDNKSP